MENERDDETKSTPREWNHHIAWLLREAAGELGEKGQSIDPAGGGARTVADTWPWHKRQLAAMRAVDTWRWLNGVFAALTTHDQGVLRARYEYRQVYQLPGLTAVFGDLAGVALYLTPNRDELLAAVSQRENSKYRPVITALRRAVKQAVREAHAEWDREFRKGSSNARVEEHDGEEQHLGRRGERERANGVQPLDGVAVAETLE